MPISCPIGLRPISADVFAELDYRVMSYAFQSQSELGRLCDEQVYRNDLAARLTVAGFSVHTEVPITLTHGDFTKVYRMDLVLNDAVVYELKSEKRLVPEHQTQLLNYLHLFGAPKGKLINFRPVSVETRFVNNPIPTEARWRMEAETTRWQETDEASARLRHTMIELLADWGGFLELSLHTEALSHFFGGDQRVLQLVPLQRDGIHLGNQRLHLLTPDTALRLTALTHESNFYERQLHALLRHSPLSRVQWINLDRHQVQFVTLNK